MVAYQVKTHVFEGPLDLLLSLIEKRKLHINDITLAKVTDDFLSYVKSFEHFPLGESASFILVASTLVLIKSKSLLPQLQLSLEEEQSIEELEKRLKIYARIRELTKPLKTLFGANIIFPAEGRKRDVVFSPDESMKTENILGALKEMLKQLPKKEILPKAVVEKVISLEEMITDLTKRVTSNLRMSFKEFSGKHKHAAKVHVIVSFLAMLELVKQGIISVTQDKNFDDIVMETERLDVPSYI